MTRRCAHCGYPSETAVECPECLHEGFETDDAGAAPPDGPQPWVLRLEFDGWSVELGKGDEARLGRDPAWSPYAEALAPYRHVSRKHAIVFVRDDGKVCIRDQESRNGTFRN